MKVTERLEKLRKIMKDKGIDYYIIPSEDAHQICMRTLQG